MASSGATPTVDLVIAVHSVDRPIARAVRSVLAGTHPPEVGGPALRLTVVCHDIDISLIVERLGDLMTDARLRLLEYRDGIRSPSGPFNAGLDASSADWISIMGSDDELEPGAVEAWLARARATRALAILPVLVRRDAAGHDAVVATPPVRPGRMNALEGVRDRLAYRSAPLGLLHRQLIGEVRFGGGLPQGEDVLFSARLWFSDTPIALASGPAYVIHDDAGDRVTFVPRPIGVALAFVGEVLDDPWFRSQLAAVRTALAAKLLRVNVLGEFVNRLEPSAWSAEERDALAGLVASIHRAAPEAVDTLPIADRRVLRALPSASGVDARRLLALARMRRAFGCPLTLLTPKPRHMLHREAPVRFMVASFFAAHRSRSATFRSWDRS